MTAGAITSAVLLGLGIAVELICCVGVLVMPDVYDKLHYTGPASTIGALSIALSIVAHDGASQGGLKAILAATLLIIANPILAHATGRALYIRQRDHLEPEPEGDTTGVPPAVGS
jgi:multicomponent Na+:H+ antiporter subunit G